ncbi:MAG: hypothetical protein QOE89_3098 [Pseudonocardiales bacterium]|nr:hypothetical protein [Pseudonocardiales bacterium]
MAYVRSLISYHFPSTAADRGGRRRSIIRTAPLTALMNHVVLIEGRAAQLCTANGLVTTRSCAGNRVSTLGPSSVTTTSSSMRAAENPSAAGQ